MQDVVIITGASSGLGLELVRSLRHEFHVVAVSRYRRRLRSLMKELAPNRLIHVRGSVAEPRTVTRAFEAARMLGGALAVVINCAGEARLMPAGACSAADLRSMIDANVVGLMGFSEAAIKEFQTQGSGLLINILSTSALRVRSGEAIYSATKWAARIYTEAAQDTCRDTPIRILAVYPGGMKTPLWRRNRHVKGLDSATLIAPELVAGRLVRFIRRPTGVKRMVIRRSQRPRLISPPHGCVSPRIHS